MRHSPRLPDKGTERNRHIDRRYLKRSHRQHNDKNPKSQMSLKAYAAAFALPDGDKPAAEGRVARLAVAAAAWLRNKATKQVRTVHPKRVKLKKSDVKIKQKKKE